MNYTYFLPYEHYTLTTSLKKEQVLEKINDVMEPEKSSFNFGFVSHSKPYSGKIEGYSFEMCRNISYRNSFLPQITGTVRSDYSGTQVEVKMKLRVLVLVFLGIFVIMPLLKVFPTLITLLLGGTADFFTFIPFGMLFFAYLITMIGFKIESRRSKKDLLDLIKAHEF